MNAPQNSRVAGARERARAEVMDELLAVASRHLSEAGAAGLSLRAVARDLGMVSSAVYRYVASRDELITALILRAYHSVGATAEDAATRVRAAGGTPGECWLEVARDVRRWARAAPHEYALIYGSPVPGYRAPGDTVTAAMRIWVVISGIMRAAQEDGSLRVPTRSFRTEDLMSPAVLEISGGRPAPPYEDAVVRSLALFASLLGAVSAEIYGHLVGFGGDDARLFDITIATAAVGVGLDLPVD